MILALQVCCEISRKLTPLLTTRPLEGPWTMLTLPNTQKCRCLGQEVRENHRIFIAFTVRFPPLRLARLAQFLPQKYTPLSTIVTF